MTALPVKWIWDGDGMLPASSFWKKRADAQYVVGQHYWMDERMERSSASHAHYFASIAECWANLPEEKQEQYPTPEHLRAWALIKAGYRNQRHIVCANPNEARKVAAFIKPLDTYAVVLADGNTVTAYTAKSQSYAAMNKEEFQRSKEAVLEVLAGLIGVAVEDLKKANAA